MATTFLPGALRKGERTSRDWIALSMLLLVALATRGIWFGDPVADFDEQLYSFIGWRMNQGDLPYVDVWDRKPFGLFLIFAAAHAVLGPGAIAYQLVALLFALGGAWLVYLLSLKLVDRASATVAGALYLMLLAAYGSYSAQSEVFHTPLMLLMLWLVLDWRRPDATKRALAAMLVGGLALQVKYTVLPQCLFFGAYALYGYRRTGASLSRLTLLAGGFAVLGVLPTALVAVWYAINGEFDAFWFANFVSIFFRDPGQSGRFWPGLLWAIAPLATIIALGFYAALRLNAPHDWRLFGLYVGWALSAFATIMLPSASSVFYYGALAAPGMLVALPLIDRRTPAGWLPAVMLIASMLWILNLPHRHEHAQTERRTEARLSAAIAPYVGTERDCLYVFDGPTALYRTTGSCQLTRFIYPDHLNDALETRAIGEDQAAELTRVLASRPGVIVTASKPVSPPQSHNLALIRQASARDYRPLITISQHNRAITAWVRRDLTP